jgi:hypothetical protein
VVSVSNVPVDVKASATAKLKGSKVKKIAYEPASTELQPVCAFLKLKLKGEARRAANRPRRGKASIRVIGTGNGYAFKQHLKVKLK